jgi:hypothetical protein
MRIADECLQCVVYIYPDEQSAREGKWAGGSGFLAHSEQYRQNFVVTNWHVIENMGAPTIRLNCKDDTVDVIPTYWNRWQKHPEGDDVAAIPFDELSDKHEAFAVDDRMFLNEALISRENIGIGDQVAMIGRLVEHDGTVRNSPTARFGFISMMPAEKDIKEFENEHEIFLVDCQSIRGFSGSPVFFIPPSTAASVEALRNVPTKLLGIDYKHVPHKEPVRTQDGKRADGLYVEANSGIAGVIPAWRIARLLNHLMGKSS